MTRDQPILVRIEMERPVDFTVWLESDGLVAEAPLFFFEHGVSIRREESDPVFEDKWEIIANENRTVTMIFQLGGRIEGLKLCVELNNPPILDDRLGETRMHIIREDTDRDCWIESNEWNYPNTLERELPS